MPGLDGVPMLSDSTLTANLKGVLFLFAIGSGEVYVGMVDVCMLQHTCGSPWTTGAAGSLLPPFHGFWTQNWVTAFTQHTP